MANGLNGKQNLRSKKGTFDNFVKLYRTIDTVLLPPPRHIEMSHAKRVLPFHNIV